MPSDQNTPKTPPKNTRWFHVRIDTILAISLFLMLAYICVILTLYIKPSLSWSGQSAPNAIDRPIKQVPKIQLENTPFPKLGQKITYKHKYQKPYTFSPNKDWFSGRVPVFTKVLEKYKGKPNVHALEIGTFEGRSSLWLLENILTNPSSTLTGIDPFVSSKESRFMKNIKLSGASERVKLINGFSQTEMRHLPLNHFDIIYIDGSHTAPDTLEDAILSWRMLKVGGILIFDDYGYEDHHPSIKVATAVDTFYNFYKPKFRVIQRGWLVVLEKTEA